METSDDSAAFARLMAWRAADAGRAYTITSGHEKVYATLIGPDRPMVFRAAPTVAAAVGDALAAWSG